MNLLHYQHYSFAFKAFIEMAKEYKVIPLNSDEKMQIGYIKKMDIPISELGKIYPAIGNADIC